MVRDPDPLLEQLSRAVSDGDAVDWLDAADAIRDDRTSRQILEQLRVLDDIARLHRDTLPEPDGPSTLPPAPLEDGDFWGHLTLRGEIGRGARGVVYRAWDPQLDREVALKLTTDREQGQGSKDVIGEARLLARVRHPHVATVYGAERRGGLVGLWMELIEGHTLERMLREFGRFNPREAALIGIDVCSALSAVHRAGLLHRDIKAQNVMRDNAGRLVLMDFGTGRDALPSAGAFVHDEVGTPLYMAPELFDGGKASVQSDIYSVGVLLYRLVTGTVPVEARSPTMLRAAHHARARRPLADVRSDLPLPFIHVVERALSVEPANRFPSAGAMEMALSGLLGTVDAPARPRGSPRRIAALAAVCATAAALAAVGMWWAMRQPPADELRFAIYPQANDEIEGLALSPDGRRLAYTSAGRLYLRSLPTDRSCIRSSTARRSSACRRAAARRA